MRIKYQFFGFNRIKFQSRQEKEVVKMKNAIHHRKLIPKKNQGF